MKIKRKKAKANSSNVEQGGPYWGLDGSKQFRKAKDELKLSYQQMADVIGANRHALWKWYWGMRRPAMPMRAKLREGFGIQEAGWLTTAERRDLEKTVRSLEWKTATKASAMARKKALIALGKVGE